MEKQKRIVWVDTGKYVCIMFVMISHLESVTPLLASFYWPFFLTMFFFLAGYVYHQPATFKEHLIKKTKGLLVPWFIFSNLNLILSSVVTLKSDRNLLEEMRLNMLQLREVGDGLWFIAALFVAFIPFYFVIKYCSAKKAIILSVILALMSNAYSIMMPGDLFPWQSNVLPWHLEYMFIGMFWMVIGYYFKGNAESFVDKRNNHITRLVVFILYTAIAYIPSDFKSQTSTAPIYTYFIGLLGILLIIMLSKVIPSNWYLTFVGSNTIIYFALHGKVYAVLEYILRTSMTGFYNAVLSNTVLSSILAISIAVVMSFLLMIPAQIINTYFPWMVGRKKKQRKAA